MNAMQAREEYNYLKSVGGRAITKRGQFAANPDEAVVWNFGLLNPEHPSGLKLTSAHQDILREMQAARSAFQHTIHVNDDVVRIDFTEMWRSDAVKQALGNEFLGFGQYTGSCVGAGGGNVQFSLGLLDVLIRNEPEKIYLPFWPLMYGRSRFYFGDRNRGEGSLESAWNKAIKDGVLPASVQGLPVFTIGDGSQQIGASHEMAWSDGDSEPCTRYLEQSKAFPIDKSSTCRNAEDVWNAIGALRPVGHGSMYGYSVTGTADDGIAIGKRGPQWSHKETIQGRRFIGSKRYFLNVNQWFYQGAKKIWIPEEDVEWICRNNPEEVIAYEGLKGIPEDKLRWVDWTKLPT